jgi:hypothetical protein
VSWFGPDGRVTFFRDGMHAAAGGALSTPGMGDRLGVEVPWRKRWC